MILGEIGDLAVVVVELHPGPDARVSRDCQDGELPILVVADRGMEVKLSPPTTPTADDVQFAENLAAALGDYIAAVRAMAA